MAFVVKKPLEIGGKRRAIGELLRDDEVVSPAIIRSGYIAKIEGEGPDSPANGVRDGGKVNLPALSKNGTTVISVAPEGIYEAVRILQLSQAEAVAAVEASGDADALTVVTLCSKNNTILSAAKKRLGELQAEENGGSEGEA